MNPPGFTQPPVWELAKRDGVLRAGEREHKGVHFFEVRLWVGNGATPTGKGATLPCDAVRSLADAMVAYADRRDGNGPLGGS